MLRRSGMKWIVLAAMASLLVGASSAEAFFGRHGGWGSGGSCGSFGGGFWGGSWGSAGSGGSCGSSGGSWGGGWLRSGGCCGNSYDNGCGCQTTSCGCDQQPSCGCGCGDSSQPSAEHQSNYAPNAPQVAPEAPQQPAADNQNQNTQPSGSDQSRTMPLHQGENQPSTNTPALP
jgi:hypothetical protein